VVIFGLMLAEGALGDWLLPVSGAAVAWWFFTAPGPRGRAGVDHGLAGHCRGGGCLTHCLGDALTEAGCPFLFPVPIAGENLVRKSGRLACSASGRARRWRSG